MNRVKRDFLRTVCLELSFFDAAAASEDNFFTLPEDTAWSAHDLLWCKKELGAHLSRRIPQITHKIFERAKVFEKDSGKATFEKMIVTGLEKFVTSVSTGSDPELRLVTNEDSPWKRHQCLLRKVHTTLDNPDVLLTQDIFKAALRNLVKQNLQSRMHGWATKAMSLEAIKDEIIRGINVEVENLCNVTFPTIELPVTPEFQTDIKAALQVFVSEACSGIFDPDGKFADVISVGMALSTSQFRERVEKLVKKVFVSPQRSAHSMCACVRVCVRARAYVPPSRSPSA